MAELALFMEYHTFYVSLKHNDAWSTLIFVSFYLIICSMISLFNSVSEVEQNEWQVKTFRKCLLLCTVLHCHCMNIFFIWHPGTIELGLRCIVWLTDFSRDACLCFFKVFMCLFNSLTHQFNWVRRKKIIAVFPLTRPTLSQPADSAIFMVKIKK